MLAAGGARYHERANDEGSLLSRSTGLREGASVETSATARAVFTVRPGWTADVRSGSSIELSQLRTEQTAVTLGRGALAMTPAPGGSGPVRVLHGGWSVESHGPVVARVESSVLRVVVLSGRTDIRRGEAEALTVTGPLVIDLPLDGWEVELSGTAMVRGDLFDGRGAAGGVSITGYRATSDTWRAQGEVRARRRSGRVTHEALLRGRQEGFVPGAGATLVDASRRALTAGLESTLALGPLRADDPTLTVQGLDTMVPVLSVTSSLPDLEARLGAIEGVLDVSPNHLVRVA